MEKKNQSLRNVSFTRKVYLSTFSGKKQGILPIFNKIIAYLRKQMLYLKNFNSGKNSYFDSSESCKFHRFSGKYQSICAKKFLIYQSISCEKNSYFDNQSRISQIFCKIKKNIFPRNCIFIKVSALRKFVFQQLGANLADFW